MSSAYQPYPQDPSGGYGQPPQGGWDSSQRGYLQGGPVGFGEAISEGFKNIVTFHGRASRSAFWWFFIGAIIIDLIGAIIGTAAHAVAIQYIIYALVAIGTVQPVGPAAARLRQERVLVAHRLHPAHRHHHAHRVLLPFRDAWAEQVRRIATVTGCRNRCPGPSARLSRRRERPGGPP